MIAFQWFAAALWAWVQREQDNVIAFLREENRVLKAQLCGRPLRLSDPERRRLADLGRLLGRRMLADVATIVSPDTILRWHRELVVGQWMYAGRRRGRPALHAHIRSLVVRMATENATWGYTRIQGALKNLGHRVGRPTIARILKEHGISPSRQRPTTWRTFVRAHWPALLDFLRTEVWTVGWVTSYTAFIMALRSRHAYRVSSMPGPDEHFLLDRMRQLTNDITGVFRLSPILICDRDSKWSSAVDRFHESTGARVIRTPVRASNWNADAKRFVRSMTEECLDRIVPLEERHLRRARTAFVTHHYSERNYQRSRNEPIERPRVQHLDGRVRRRQRLGGILSYYYRAAA